MEGHAHVNPGAGELLGGEAMTLKLQAAAKREEAVAGLLAELGAAVKLAARFAEYLMRQEEAERARARDVPVGRR